MHLAQSNPSTNSESGFKFEAENVGTAPELFPSIYNKNPPKGKGSIPAVSDVEPGEPPPESMQVEDFSAEEESAVDKTLEQYNRDKAEK